MVRLAQRADSTYGSARAAWAAAQERLPQGRAGLLPIASLSASAQRDDRRIQFRDAAGTVNDSTFNSDAITLSVTQPIFRLQNSIVYKQATTQVEQADAQLALAAQEVILRTAQAYFDVLLARDNVAFAEAQKSAISQQLGQAKRNFEVGTAPVTDVNEAQARFDLTTAQEIAARNELELRRRALEQVIGSDPPPLAPLGPAFILKAPEPFNVDPWLSLAAQNNLQVRVARHTLTFSGQEIERNRAAHLPTLDVFANVSNSGAGAGNQGGAGNDTRNRVVGLQVAIPLYSGGITTSRVREAIANEDRSRQDLETARRAAVFGARQAFLGMTNGTALVRALEAALVSTQSQLASTRVGQEVGVRTLVDVLNAQQLLFSARRDLAQAKYNYILSQLRLEAAIGELTEDDVALVNQWLDRSALGRLHEGPAAMVSDRKFFMDPPTATAIAAPDRPAAKKEASTPEAVGSLPGQQGTGGSENPEKASQSPGASEPAPAVEPAAKATTDPSAVAAAIRGTAPSGANQE